MLSFFRDVARFGYNHSRSLTVVLAPYLILIALFKAVSIVMAEQQPLWHGFYLSVLLAIYPLYMGRLIRYMAWAAGPSNETPKSIAMNAADWRRLFLTNLIITALVSCGLLLFLVPGIYLAARFAFAEFITILRGDAPTTALEKSWREAGPHMWVLFLGTFIILGTSTVLEILTLPDPDTTLSVRVLVGLFGEFISISGALVLAVFFFRIYCLKSPRM